jgi:hypothetical protein
MRFRGLLFVAASAAIALGAGGCSNSTTAPAVDLSGTYGLVSIQFGTGTTPLTPPAETGTFSLSATTYSVTLSGQVPEQDTGTYKISGSTWSQISSSQGGAQSTGTYTLNGSTLTVTTTQGGVVIVSVWQKLS